MAIVRFKEKLPEAAAGSWSLDGGRRYTVRVYAWSDDKLDGPETVLNATGVRVGDTYRYPLTTEEPHETNDRLFINSIECSGGVPCKRNAIGAVQRFELTLTYTPADPSKNQGGPVGPDGFRNPFLAPPRVSWRTEWEDFACTHDNAGVPILNKAGDPFDPPLVIPNPTPVVVIQRVEREYNHLWMQNYVSRINSDAWEGFPAGSVLCRDITGNLEWNTEVDGWVWQTEYVFAIRMPIVVSSTKIFPGWAAQVLNAGMREKVSGERRAIFDGMTPVASPVPLKSDGTKAGASDPPVFLSFDIYPTAAFSGLGLPAGILSLGTPEV